MDSIFQLSEGDRADFLQHLSHSFGCTFICLWSYLPQPSNCLLFMDGIYHEENKQPSSSSGPTRARTLFNEYQKSIFIVDNSGAPGFAFKNSLPFIQFKELELQTLASTKTQLQFYHEARIKTAIFMGCKTGEIELGMSIDTQADFEMKMRNCFPEDFSQQFIPIQLPQPTDQNPPPSSSSSLRSLSIDSPDGTMPNFLFNNNSISTNSSYPLEPSVRQALIPTTIKPVQTLSQIRNIQFPTLLQSEDDAMTQAILAVISSSSSPSSSTNSSQKPQQNSSAFKSYRSVLAPTSQITSRIAQKQNMLKRAIAFIRSTSNTLMQNQEQIQNGDRPTSNQLNHMISERRRREKLNESFKALRSLLPPGSKKDKASVLSNTTEYVNSLKAEVEELSRKNQILEAQLLQNDQSTDNQESALLGGSSNNDQRLDVRITNIIAETTPEARILDLRVSVRGQYCGTLDLAIRVLEFLKQLRNVSLISVEADTRMVLEEATSVNRLGLRLKIEGEEWNETTFQEAVRRVVADLAH